MMRTLDPDSDEEGEQAAFYTPSLNPTVSKTGPGTAPVVTGQSEVTLSLSIGKGIGSFYAPLQVGLIFSVRLYEDNISLLTRRTGQETTSLDSPVNSRLRWIKRVCSLFLGSKVTGTWGTCA